MCQYDSQRQHFWKQQLFVENIKMVVFSCCYCGMLLKAKQTDGHSIFSWLFIFVDNCCNSFWIWRFVKQYLGIQQTKLGLMTHKLSKYFSYIKLCWAVITLSLGQGLIPKHLGNKSFGAITNNLHTL